jgi:hypothetical protein
LEKSITIPAPETLFPEQKDKKAGASHALELMPRGVHTGESNQKENLI